MTSTPLISVVMPVYNTAKFLSKSIDSVLAQTYNKIEIIILDDASSDNSWDIIQQYAKKDNRIKAYSIPFVEGPKVARDAAIRRTSGAWIVPVDSDDTIEIDYIERLWKRHEETGADFIGSKTVLVDEQGSRLGNTIPNSDFDYSAVYSGTEAMLRILSDWQFSASGALWNRSVMTNICKEGTKYDYSDEYDTRVYLNNCSKVAFADTEYYYTQNTSSCTHKKNIHSISFILFNKIKLKAYFEEKYGYGCALAEYYCQSSITEYKKTFPKFVKYCIKSKAKLSDDYNMLLTKSYSMFRDRYYKSNFIQVQYYRLLWALLRKIC